MEVVFYFVIVTINATLVGLVLTATARLPLLLVVAQASALLAALHYSFVIMSFIAPLLQVLYLYLKFNLTFAFNIHKRHFHVRMAITTIFFSFIHIITHSIQWSNHPVTKMEQENQFTQPQVLHSSLE
jgi:hypothetical protein